MKFKKLQLLFFFIVFLNKGFSQNKINLYSEISYNSIPAVTLSEYKSVQDRDNHLQNPKIALGIGISGGGSRAQFFSLGVLLELEEIQDKTSGHNFLNEIDYYSTVSGGCYSAGYYLSVLKNKLRLDNCTFNEFYFSKADSFKSDVNKSASLFSLLNNNRNEKGEKISMAQRLDFEVLQYDSTSTGSQGKFKTQMLLSDFFIPKESKQNPELPMMVANGTAYSNGERFPFMPHIIRALKINSSLAPNKAQLQLDKDEINNGYNFPLTYAITASSAFPGVLPKTKFGVKDQEKILCVIDGGASDNTGYETLMELLRDDTIVDNKNKKALFIDCLGQGKKSPFINDEKIRLISLLETASLYTVQTRYITFDKDLENVFEKYKIPNSNYQIIGFTTLRDYLVKLKKDQDYDKLVAELKNSTNDNDSWHKIYNDFSLKLKAKFDTESFKKDQNGDPILSSLATEQFKDFDAGDILILYEYASHVETKLKITPEEKEMLLLSGRFAVYLKSNELKGLLEEYK